MINKRIKAVLLKLAELTNDKIRDYNAEFDDNSDSTSSSKSTKSTKSTKSIKLLKTILTN